MAHYKKLLTFHMADVISISLPAALTKTVDKLAKANHQTRSEFVRAALHDYIAEEEAEARYALKVYHETRNDKTYTHAEVKKMLGLI